jgi:NADP-dependent 3-hydroxy acid dehydrogenase YdfG
MAGLASVGEIAVTRDASGVASALVAELRARHLAARVVDVVDASVAGVVFLAGLDDARDEDEAVAINLRAFETARAIAPRASTQGGVFVTVQDTGGDFGLSGSRRALVGGLAGLAKTASLEWPLVSVKAIDVERGDRTPAEIARAIADELLEGGTDLEVGLAVDGRRTTLVSRRQELAPQNAGGPLSNQSVIVCSGGARGVTAATLIAVAKKWRPRIVLLGRTPLEDEPDVCRDAHGDADLKRALMQEAKARGHAIKPAELGARVGRILAGREVRATIAALEAAGSPVRYLATDVADGEKLARALDDVRRDWGPVTAIVHGAGVIRDKHIADKTVDDVRAVLSPKIDGLRALLAETERDPLAAIVLFSSVAGRTGNVGQCDYAMANEMLNKIAAREARRREGCVVKSLNWGPWEAGMVSPALKSYFESHGVALIPLDVGATMLIDELCSGDRHVEIVLGNKPERTSIAGDRQSEPGSLVRIAADRQPYLADHAIDGSPVVPAVMVIEWFVRAAEAMFPGKLVSAVRDLRVLRGVRLERFLDGGDWLLVVPRNSAEGALDWELRDPNQPNVARYRARVELSDALPLSHAREAQPITGSLGRPIYGEALFHGPAFQVIRSVDGVGREGIAGTLVGTHAQRWPGEWRTDPAMLDGGLQLAVLWAQHCLGGRGLPTSLRAFHRYGTALGEGALRCTVTGRTDGATQAVCDIEFALPDGRLVARLDGVETHQRP